MYLKRSGTGNVIYECVILYSTFRLSVAYSTAGGDGTTADSTGPDRQIKSNTPAALQPTMELLIAKAP